MTFLEILDIQADLEAAGNKDQEAASKKR